MRPARLLIALVLAASLLAVGGPVSADDPTRGSDPAVGEPSETGPAKSSLDQSPLLRGSALQKPKRYSPKPGVVFNAPWVRRPTATGSSARSSPPSTTRPSGPGSG